MKDFMNVLLKINHVIKIHKLKYFNRMKQKYLNYVNIKLIIIMKFKEKMN
jgi:hypothetical protein